MKVCDTVVAGVEKVILNDGTTALLIKEKNSWMVYREGRFTGYKFRSLKKALEFCEGNY